MPVQGNTQQGKVQQARQAMSQTNQQFLTEIGQLAQLIEQMEPNQSLKQLASQITTLSSQVRFNEQTETKI